MSAADKSLLDTRDETPPLSLDAHRILGQPVPRLEDPPLIRGEGAFADDINFPRQLAMRVVRSPIAHGLLNRVDVSEARKCPGVVAIWVADDIRDIQPIPLRAARPTG